VNVCYGSPSGHTIESNIELAFDPPELSRWQRFWRSGWGIATAFVALIAAVLILPLKALAVAAVFVAVSLGVGGVVAGVRSSNRGSGFWDGLGRFITDNWSSSVALGSAAALTGFGIKKAAVWISKAGSKKQVASGVLPKSMTNLDARIWYDAQVRAIPNNVKGLTWKTKAKNASAMRNELKTITRNAMMDVKQAAMLDAKMPIMPFEEFVIKYSSQGFARKALWKRIVKAAGTPNRDVSATFGIFL